MEEGWKEKVDRGKKEGIIPHIDTVITLENATYSI